jgi:dephospho-CoA kinase
MLKISITGGIGSGKTTVSRIFEILEIPVFYADDMAKSVMHTDEPLIKSIKQTFGSEAYNSDHTLNRKYLADLVFNNEKKLAKLNQLVHPAVFRAFDAWLKVQSQVPYILKEAALLFESGSYKLCDKNILVTAPEELKIKRVMQRDKISAEEVKARMNKQIAEEEGRKLADFIIVNDEKTLLIPQVLELHQGLINH